MSDRLPEHVLDAAVDAADSLFQCYPHTLTDFRTDVAAVVDAVLGSLSGRVVPKSDGLGVKSRSDLDDRLAAENARECP